MQRLPGDRDESKRPLWLEGVLLPADFQHPRIWSGVTNYCADSCFNL